MKIRFEIKLVAAVDGSVLERHFESFEGETENEIAKAANSRGYQLVADSDTPAHAMYRKIGVAS